MKWADTFGFCVLNSVFWAKILSRFKGLIWHHHDWLVKTSRRFLQNFWRFNWNKLRLLSIFFLQRDHQHRVQQRMIGFSFWPCILRKLVCTFFKWSKVSRLQCFLCWYQVWWYPCCWKSKRYLFFSRKSYRSPNSPWTPPLRRSFE